MLIELYWYQNMYIDHCKFTAFHVNNFKPTNWCSAGKYVPQKSFSSDRFNCYSSLPEYIITVQNGFKGAKDTSKTAATF